MVADGLLTRQRYREVPPRVDYELTERSRELMPVLGALAKWGFDWTWSAPRPGEAIDVGAIFRVAPGLLSPAPAAEGAIELVVEAEGTRPARTYTVTIAGGAVSVAERPADDPDARVAGSTHGWVAALTPEGTAEGLELSGSRRLADAVLEGLSGSAARAARAAA
jgi:hypothetical protein